MAGGTIFSYIKQLQRSVFTTYELAAVSGKSLSATTQALNFLKKEGIVFKIYRGVWSENTNERISPYAALQFLFPRQRAYVSFLSALHIYGIIEQIPQVITVASLTHSKTINTKIGVFCVHRIQPLFFGGFGWYKGSGSFLIAEPEKALIDCLYLSARRKKQFGYFPELEFPKSFSFKKAKYWVRKIPNYNLRIYVRKKLAALEKKQ
jgi:predicted transcriptional regulator of viral defense system